MRGKVLVFDLDGTLCEIGEGMRAEDICALQRLEAMGNQIAVCSGKPGFYLTGFMRQVNLKTPILIGENGATFQIGVDLPPKEYYVLPYKEEAREQIRMLRDWMDAHVAEHIWYQPNVTELTPFITEQEIFDRIQEFVDLHRQELTDLLIYRHVDCFDFIPAEINKKRGLAFLAEKLGKHPEDFIAIGDGPNDVPMFSFAGESILITRSRDIRPDVKTDMEFATIGQALAYLEARED